MGGAERLVGRNPLEAEPVGGGTRWRGNPAEGEPGGGGTQWRQNAAENNDVINLPVKIFVYILNIFF